jgi:hypothetical protein
MLIKKPAYFLHVFYCKKCDVYHQFSFDYEIIYIKDKFSFQEFVNLLKLMNKINSSNHPHNDIISPTKQS